jgi:hypothetical protein
LTFVHFSYDLVGVFHVLTIVTSGLKLLVFIIAIEMLPSAHLIKTVDQVEATHTPKELRVQLIVLRSYLF